MSNIAEEIIVEKIYSDTSLLDHVTTKTRADRVASTSKRRREAAVLEEEG